MDENDDEMTIDDYAERKAYDDRFRMRPRPRSLIARGTKVVRVEEFDEEAGQWRSRIKMSSHKFDDKAKGVFLDVYREWGRIGEAAASAGVSTQTVRHYMKEDEEFGNACLLAEEEYRDKLIAHHQNLVFNGTEKVSYDRNGNIVSRETIYPVRLIELELKKHDSGYRDKQEIAVQHSGGVLVAPAEMKTIDDWESRFAKAKDVTPKISSSSSDDEPY